MQQTPTRRVPPRGPAGAVREVEDALLDVHADPASIRIAARRPALRWIDAAMLVPPNLRRRPRRARVRLCIISNICDVAAGLAGCRGSLRVRRTGRRSTDVPPATGSLARHRPRAAARHEARPCG